MRFERHARTRFISSKSTLVNFQQGWKNKPQVAMKLPDFCLTPLESLRFQSCCIHRQIHPLGCWDPRAWSVYQFERPTYACAKNEANLCLCRFDLSAANNLSNRTPTTAHTRYKVRFRPHSRAKTAPISSFSHLCKVAFESVILNEFLDFGSNSRQKSCFFCHVTNTLCEWLIQCICTLFFSISIF